MFLCGWNEWPRKRQDMSERFDITQYCFCYGFKEGSGEKLSQASAHSTNVLQVLFAVSI